MENKTYFTLKQKLSLAFYILFLTILLTKPYLQMDFPYTHDGENHLARFANYKVAVREGQFPPRWAPNLFNHFGYPVFNFNYPLANIISLPFSALDVHYETTFKLIMILGSVFGLIGMSWLLFTYNTKISVNYLGLSLFALHPYLINISFYRGNIGEFLSLMLLPWVLLMIRSKWPNQKIRLIMPVVFASFLLSHNLAVVMSLPLLIAYAWYETANNQKARILLFRSGLIALGLVAWFWVPALLEQHLTVVTQTNLTNETSAHLVYWYQLLFAPLRFGFSRPGPVDGLSFSLGWAQLMVLIASIIWLLQSKRQTVFQPQNHLLIALVVVSLGWILFQLNWTQLIWHELGFLSIIQFPWRLSLGLVITTPVLYALIEKQLPNSIQSLLLILVFSQLIAVSGLNAIDYFHKQPVDYDLYAQSTSTLSENRSKTFTHEYFQDPIGWQPRPIIDGEGEAVVEHWTGTSRKYQLSLKTPSTVIEQTMNFAGWQTNIIANNQSQIIDYTDNQQIGGRIAYSLPAGEYQVSTKFTQRTPARLLGNLISIVAIGWWLYPQLLLTKRYVK